MGINIPIFFMAWDLNSIVFKSENLVGMEKITLYFVVGVFVFFNHFQWGNNGVQFSTGADILATFSSGWGSLRVCEKGVFEVDRHSITVRYVCMLVCFMK